MSYGNQSYLRFSLEESVWFQRGQEVEELISIALDPNITINESDQYVTIKGSLELYGEYNRDENDFDEENDFFSNPKFVQTVEVREEGVCYFTHHFPVEITIPKNRIQTIENIDVAVETFDYAFPERSCLRLSADLMITGLYGEQQHEYLHEQEDEFIEESDYEEETEYAPLYREEELEDEQENEFDDETEFQDQQEIPIHDLSSEYRSPFSRPDFDEEEETVAGLYEPFEVEARKEAKADETLKSLTEELERKEIRHNQQFKEEPESIAETYDFTFQEREENQEADFEPAAIEEEDSKNAGIPEIFFAAKRKEAEFQAGIPVDEEPQGIAPLHETPQMPETQPHSETQPANEVEPVHEQEAESPEDESSPEPKGKKKKWKKKQSLSITEFLARKEEESESHTRVRVCIVQKNDTIDKLSERYDVTVSQLQRVNNLELNQDVYEGQVLYIPVAQNQK